MRNVVREAPRGLNVQALLEACPDDLPRLRNRALLSVAYEGSVPAEGGITP